MRPPIDYTLTLVTDPTLMSTATLSEAVTSAVNGGCTLIQLRDKTASDREFFAMAQELRALTRSYQVPLIINDRLAIALSVDADGVHIGQNDLPAVAVRDLLGPDKILGVSVHTLEEAQAAQKAQADYLGVGAMFSTATKTDASTVTMAELERIRQNTDLPLVLIGGISPENIPRFYGCGVDGMAVVSAIIAQPDIEQAAREIKRLTLRVKAAPRMQACVFDLDGTLFDSMQVWEQIDQEFLGKRGIAVPPDYTEAIACLGLRRAAEYTIQRFGFTDDTDALVEEWKAMAVQAYSQTVTLKPYAREYLQKLKTAGIKLAVATSLPPSLYTPALQRLGIEPLFDALCSVEEVARGKNHPDIFLLAAQRLNIAEKNIYLFEDNLSAIRSAKKTGMTVYGIYDSSAHENWNTIKKTAHGTLRDFKDAPLPR